MSPRSSKPKPAADPGIYDGLMIVSCAALLAGIIFLVLHMGHYGWEIV